MPENKKELDKCGNLIETPTMEAIQGLRFDFCDGFRLQCPPGNGKWHIRLIDLDEDKVVESAYVSGGELFKSKKRYFAKWKVLITSYVGTGGTFEHEYNAEGKEVLIRMAFGALGDTFGWIPYVEKFRVKHKCRLILSVDPKFIPLFENTYPEIKFITKEAVGNYAPYASYKVCLFGVNNRTCQPYDYRKIALHKHAAYILGVDDTEEPPRFDLSAPRTIMEPYVCISSFGSTQCKCWNNPRGWLDVVNFLNDSGYRVLDIDKYRGYGSGWHFNYLPYGSENFTGDKPLQERIDLLHHADFFIGLSSGLSWMAWGCKIPVVMISGFTYPWHEFYTPYRVFNETVCHGCWNEERSNGDFFWCPRHKGDDRQFECTRKISSEQVIETIKRIPAFQKHMSRLS